MKNRWWLLSFLACLALAALAPLASPAPDGLERVATDQGFGGAAQASPFRVVADYVFPGIHNEALATIMAAWLGVVALFALAYGATWLLLRRRREA